MPKQPPKNRRRTPSRSTYWAAANRPSACPAVSLTVATSFLVGVRQHLVAHDRDEVLIRGDESAQRAAGGAEVVELLDGEPVGLVGSPEVRQLRLELREGRC